MNGIIYVLVLLGIGYFVGRTKEKKHFESIRLREKKYSQIAIVTDGDCYNGDYGQGEGQEDVNSRYTRGELVMGSVVISTDYFKMIAASLKGFVGGRITSFESLVDRGRREAILRMQEKASFLGAEAVLNTRIETTTVGNISNGGGVGSIEVVAYGTAVKAQ